MAVLDDRGFWKNKRGEFVHPDMVRADEKLKDELIDRLIKKVLEIREILKEFKKEAFGSVEDYFALLLQEYGIDAKAGSKRGNITLEDFAGLNKISIAISDSISFDEKLNIAKIKIDECLEEWTKDSGKELKTIVKEAFRVDKKGNLNTQRILELRRYDIEHPKWREAMEVINDSIEVVSSKRYIRFYNRKDVGDAYKQLSLDFSKIDE